ncbi:MAG: c-type cytochrome [Pirellulales bacterium]|nr:c-type cytochrome [Pirellulales bacterium]
MRFHAALFLYISGLLTCGSLLHAETELTTISGRVVNAAGVGLEGVMVSAVDNEKRKWTSVFTQKDGAFVIRGLRDVDHKVRTRLMGLADEWRSVVEAGTNDLTIETHHAVGEELELQRPASSAFGMLKFDNPRDKMNFKMFCTYCHQVGTLGFRTPEKPVDWQTMIRRMDGFGGLYPHTKETIVRRLQETYSEDAVKQWPTFEAPPAPTGAATAATITMWELDELHQGSFHDLEIGPDGKVYAVNISKRRMVALDPNSGEQTTIDFPRNVHAPHSIETANDGSLWTTMCASGKMARYDIETNTLDIYSSAEAPKQRGSYPHTLRINPKDPEGLIWYTDAGSNSCFSMHPKTGFVKEYKLLSAGQAVAAGRGESRGITPYGIDYSPVDGSIWYSKLNGNRIGRIDPKSGDGDIMEWNPPFRGPRRLHIGPDGMIWVPGFGSGVFGKFNPDTEKWTIYELPDNENQTPYALNVDKDGIVWICGTANDTINRFDPETELFVEYRLPMRVSYTREIEFDDDGNVWTSTSGPARHMERGVGAVIKISLPKTLPADGGIKLEPRFFDGNHAIGNLATSNRPKPNNKELFARIDKEEMPKAYFKQPHQQYVDARMAQISEQNRGKVGQLWNEFRRMYPDRSRDGQMFVRIMEYVFELDAAGPQRRFINKWQHHYFGEVANNLESRSIENGKAIFDQATCSRCHSIEGKGANLGPELSGIYKRFQGAKLVNQIVRPSAEINKDFQPQLIVVDTGQVLTGVVTKETEEQLTVLPNMLKPEKTHVLAKASIDERQTSNVSSMPVGLLDTFTIDEILDLVAYIQSVAPLPKDDGAE